MPSFINSALAAYFLGVSAVSASYYGYGTGTGSSPAPTSAPVYPYSNGTAPHGFGTGYYTDYTTTTVCETKTYTDSYGHVTYETIPVYTTVCPLTTKTIYAETCSTDTYGSVTTSGYEYTTVVPVTTYYPPATTFVPGAPSSTGSVPSYPTYATGAASSLQISGLAAVVVVAAALVL